MFSLTLAQPEEWLNTRKPHLRSPKSQDTTNLQDAQKSQEPPKSQDAPKSQDTPKSQDALANYQIRRSKTFDSSLGDRKRKGWSSCTRLDQSQRGGLS